MSRAEELEPKTYFSIIQGNFRTQANQDDPKAVRRDYDPKDGTGVKIKYERVYRALYGYITDVSFYDTEFGMKISITLDKGVDGKQPVISMNAATREAEDFLKKLPNIDFTQEVQLRPYSFTGRENDEVRGMGIAQPDEHGEFKKNITNFFYQPSADGKSPGTAINGFPTPEGNVDNYTKDHWKMHFTKCRLFLIDYTNEHIVPKIKTAAAAIAPKVAPPAEKDIFKDVNPNDIPF